MAALPDLPALEAFAAECLAAERFPDDYHLFTPWECPGSCGLAPLQQDAAGDGEVEEESGRVHDGRNDRAACHRRIDAKPDQKEGERHPGKVGGKHDGGHGQANGQPNGQAAPKQAQQ